MHLLRNKRTDHKVRHTDEKTHGGCCTLTLCVVLLPYVSLAQFEECAEVRICPGVSEG